MTNFRKLEVWERSRSLALNAGDVARAFVRKAPRLSDQMERAVEAIPALLAEGRAKTTDREFARYVTMAVAEANETENHLQSAADRRLISSEEHASLTERTVEVRKMLIGLRKTLK